MYDYLAKFSFSKCLKKDLQEQYWEQWLIGKTMTKNNQMIN